MTPLRTLLAAAAVVGLVGAGAALYPGSIPAHASPPSAPTALTDSSIPDVAERVVDSVVNISTSHAVETGPASFDPFFSDPFSPGFGEPGDRKAMSKGSGVVVTASGRILTNAHVVKDADDITVTLHDGNDYDAKVVGVDPKADLAVLQLKGNLPTLKPLTFGDSAALRLGEVVLAIGDPFGVGKSVTMGIVSAKGRAGMGIEEYEDFIQTDAAINPGNSGGALVNLRGELIGINTAIASKSGGYAGIGFAIPTNMARPIMEMLIKDGKVSRGYLGVQIGNVTPATAKQAKLAVQHGAYVAAVDPNGPAARAGLAEGDVVVALNGTEIRSDYMLRNTIAMTRPGATVDLDVIHRSGGKGTVKAKLGELPNNDNVVRGRPAGRQRRPQQQQQQQWPQQQQQWP
ncbi:MAG TPA: trypsin-like peptidase domain-containing protein [Kofleriaceae bacterium]|jgi:Do/DeqQ family serine protease|nr:trypsin-like peptidase domain-containing protein [Kofleriaceae bacterium]